jgi:putative toxin-antitoxin system antitoxin component (TIGR02293 family)
MQPSRAEKSDIQTAAELLGGARILRHRPGTPVEVHDLILRGLPVESVAFLITRVVNLPKATVVEKGIGISQRTMQRHAPKGRLSPEQGNRAWKFATILAKAIKVFGSREAAEGWLQRPAVGLNGQRPIDLLTTVAGAELVENFLGRLEYGVYT